MHYKDKPNQLLLSFPISLSTAWVFLALFILSIPVGATDALTIDKSSNKVPLAKYTDYHCAQESLDSIHEAETQTFQAVTTPQINFGVLAGECWLRFSLRNGEDSSADYFIEIPFGLLDYLDLYIPEGNTYKHVLMGDQYFFYNRDLRVPIHTALVSLEANETKILYLRAKTYNTLNLPLHVSSLRPYIEHSQYQQWISGLFYGFAVGLVVFGIYIFLYFREIAYVHYSIHIIAVLFVYLALDGHSMRIWPESVNWQDLSLAFFSYLALLSGIQFADYYLNVHEIKPLAKSSRIISWSLLLGICLLFFIPFKFSILIAAVIAIAAVLQLLALCVIQVNSGLDTARYYIIGWVLFLFMVVAIIVSTFGIFTVTIDPIFGIKISFITQQFLNAIGIGRKIKQLQNEQQTYETQAIQAQAENSAKSEFLAKMSHEIRTPMNAVLGILQLLLGSSMDKETKALLRTAHHSGNGLMDIINDILDYSKIEAGMLKLEAIAFDLKQLVSECGQLFSIPAEEKGVELIWRIEEDVPQYIHSDPTRLRQIINNLLSNALKFTAEGKIEICVSKEPTSSDSELVLRIDVNDSGIGISNSDAETLFKSFQQADESTTRKYGGTGLGLAICQQLVELMGGKISAAGEPGIGSTFSFTIVTSVANAVDNIDDDAGTDGSLPNLAGFHVLIAEDNPVNMLIITRLLNKTQIEITAVEDGEQALSTYCSSPGAFNFILMDCEMPKMDGFAATKSIREQEKQHELKQTPIIALTAHATADIRERCDDAGINDFLPKPIDLKHLNEILNKWSVN